MEDINQKLRLIKVLFLLGLLITFLASLSSPLSNSYYVYLLLFPLLFWQRQRLYKFFNLRKTKLHLAVYLLFSLFWSLLLVVTRGRPIFGTSLTQSYFIELGFYLPYFAFWYFLQKRFAYSSWEIFSLAGISRVLFEGTVTRTLYLPLALVATNGATIALIAFVLKIIATFFIFGILTLMPLAAVFQTDNFKEKGFKEYLLGLSTGFAAALIFLVWGLGLKYLAKR